MSNYISARVMTRDGHHLSDAVNLIGERKQQSERRQMLAMVARIEARLELERALKRGPVAMATATPIIRKPGAMASRNPGKIHPAPVNSDAEDFGLVDRILSGAIKTLLIMAAVMTAIAIAGGVA